jgi:hypothetical protein
MNVRSGSVNALSRCASQSSAVLPLLRPLWSFPRRGERFRAQSATPKTRVPLQSTISAISQCNYLKLLSNFENAFLQPQSCARHLKGRPGGGKEKPRLKPG